MARDSRPPGFDMSYRPLQAQRFGPSLRACSWSYAYAGVAVLFAALVAYGHVARPGSWAYDLVFERGARAMPASWFAMLALCSGLAAVLQAHLRGVILRPDGIELLEFAALGFPRVRRLDWPLIDRFRFDTRSTVGLDLWDGSYAFLPEVADREGLVRALGYIAMARAIPYTGDPGVEPLD